MEQRAARRGRAKDGDRRDRREKNEKEEEEEMHGLERRRIEGRSLRLGLGFEKEKEEEMGLGLGFAKEREEKAMADGGWRRRGMERVRVLERGGCGARA